MFRPYKKRRDASFIKHHNAFSTWSGRRGSNSRPLAWKANALSTELLPQLISFVKRVGEDGFEPPKTYVSRFTVCPIWPLWYSPRPYLLHFLASQRADGGIRTPDQLITNQLLWPTELHRHLECKCKNKKFTHQNLGGKIRILLQKVCSKNADYESVPWHVH